MLCKGKFMINYVCDLGALTLNIYSFILPTRKSFKHHQLLQNCIHSTNHISQCMIFAQPQNCVYFNLKLKTNVEGVWSSG